ncbi:MAG: hypothetical protein WCY88_11350 [Spongiibacteraceae bacterium]
MIGIGSGGEDCPFQFNFDASTFKVGDIISYRVPDAFGETPFVGEITSVAEDHIFLRHYGEPAETATLMRGTLEDRPVVSQQDALGEQSKA